MNVKCPKCRNWTIYSPENPYRPFCSERCSILDLGAWADENYSIPVESQDPDSVNANEDFEFNAELNTPKKH